MGSIVPYLLRQPWSPKRAPGLAAWWKAEAGITADGSNAVSSWEDQSGHARTLTQAVGASQPTWTANVVSGLPGVVFDGSSDLMQTAAFTLAQPVTVYCLFKHLVQAGDGYVLDGLANDSLALYYPAGTANLTMYAGAGVATGSTLANNTFGVVSAVFNGASSGIQTNNSTRATGNAGTAAPNGITVGRYNGGAVYGSITLCELIIRAANDDATMRQLHINYLARRGGLNL